MQVEIALTGFVPLNSVGAIDLTRKVIVTDTQNVQIKVFVIETQGNVIAIQDTQGKGVSVSLV